MRGDKKGWYKVSDLVVGAEIAVPSKTGEMIWDEIVSIRPVGREQVYDIEVEGTHNLVGNGIFAHNTFVLRANTMLAVEGEVHADSFVAPAPFASSTLMAEIPPSVLTADGAGVDLYKLSTYNLSVTQALAAALAAEDARVASLETRVEALESGAVSTATSSLLSSLSTTSLASAFSSLSAFIKDGLAQFGSLVADRFVAATNSAGTSSAGSVTVLAGNTVAQINNAYMATSTKVFVTFNSPVTGNWYVSDKTAGSFRVVLSTAQTADTSFDYFLVQTAGQATTTTATSTDSGPSVTQGTGMTAPAPAPATTTTTTTTPATATSTPPVSDTTPPVVTLAGAAAMEINVGDLFTDPGATALDDTDGDITSGIVVTGTVDTMTAGSYTLSYSATDAAGNIGFASRLVTVVIPAPAPAPAPADTTATTTP